MEGVDKFSILAVVLAVRFTLTLVIIFDHNIYGRSVDCQGFVTFNVKAVSFLTWESLQGGRRGFFFYNKPNISMILELQEKAMER